MADEADIVEAIWEHALARTARAYTDRALEEGQRWMEIANGTSNFNAPHTAPPLHTFHPDSDFRVLSCV